MPRRVLDTNILINFWGDKRRAAPRGRAVTVEDARQWAKELIKLYGTNAILTPIYIEYVSGKGSAREVSLARAYLEEFETLDADRIPPADWREARRIALRVRRDAGRRQLGDCIIRAICNRLNLDVLTADKRFPE